MNKPRAIDVYTKEAYDLVRDILYASGSSINNFSLHKTRQAMYDIAQKHLDAHEEKTSDIIIREYEEGERGIQR